MQLDGRQADIRETDIINEKALKTLVRAAIALNQTKTKKQSR